MIHVHADDWNEDAMIPTHSDDESSGEFCRCGSADPEDISRCSECDALL